MRFSRIVSCAVLIVASVFVAPGAEAAPEPVSSCSLIPVTTDVIVTADLSCTTTAIVVGAPGIKVDLGGHVVDGDLLGLDYGVDNSAGHDDVTVVNGAVRNFQIGIRGDGGVDGANDMTVNDVVTSGNSDDSIFIDGDSASIKSVFASGNATGGISISGNFASIASATASGNNTSGISIVGDSASIKSVTAAGNGANGIEITGASASVMSATASGNAFSGIVIDGNLAFVKSVTASGNGSDGVHITAAFASTNPVVRSATVSGNGSYGIFINGSNASVKSVTASGNAINGIQVEGPPGTLPASISGNRAYANGFPAGASDEGGRGISFGGFGTPTGTNVALGNDDPFECVPASLC